MRARSAPELTGSDPDRPTYLSAASRESSALLAAAMTPFLGRQQELRAISLLLTRERLPLVTLTGPGGVGKTRLAQHIAARMRERLPDGVIVLSLATVSDPEQVAPTLAAAIAPDEPSALPPMTRMITALSGRQMLLVLDNFEHVLPAAALVADLGRACPELRILVTSRAPLHVSHERVFPIAPLHLPDTTQHSPRQIEQSSAVQLFVERSRDVLPSFQLTDENAPLVAEICRKLDGLPLAIELAAARSAVLAPREMLTRLTRRLPLLTSGPRDAPTRLRTMSAAIAWSCDLLTDDERRLFRWISIFAGGCSLDVLERLATEKATQPQTASLAKHPLDIVASLVDHSLIQQNDSGAGGSRFTMLETIREFGLQLLEDANERESAHRWLAAWCVEFVETAEPKLWGADQREWFDRLEGEYDNIRVALSWTVSAIEAASAMRMCGALWLFWNARGYMDEGQRWAERSVDLPGDVPNDIRAKALNVLGNLTYECGGFADAQVHYQRSLTAYREAEYADGIADTLNNLGLMAIMHGELPSARSFLQESLDLRRTLDDQYGLPPTLCNLADIAAMTGNLTEAEARYQEALDLARELGSLRRVGYTLDGLATVTFLRGEPTQALALLEQSVRAFQNVGDRNTIAAVLSHVGWVEVHCENHTHAAACFRDALGHIDHATSTNRGQTIEICLEGIVRLSMAAGRIRTAVRMMGARDRLSQTIGASHPYLARDTEAGAIRTRARRRLGPSAFTATLETGHALAINDVLKAARDAADLLSHGASHEREEGRPPDQGPSYDLSPREREVLRLVVDGRSDREIAAELSISPRTVNVHVSNILCKMEVSSRTAAVAIAIHDKLA